jgi:hypothetical protein
MNKILNFIEGVGSTFIRKMARLGAGTRLFFFGANLFWR